MMLLLSTFFTLVLIVFAGGYFNNVYQQKTKLKKMNGLAANKGGKCLSDKYVNSSTKLKWECG